MKEYVSCVVTQTTAVLYGYDADLQTAEAWVVNNIVSYNSD